MTTTHTSVTDAEVIAALVTYYKDKANIGSEYLQVQMRRALEQHEAGKSRQPSSEAVELPPLPEPAISNEVVFSGIAVNKSVIEPYFTASQMREYATAAIKAAHPSSEAVESGDIYADAWNKSREGVHELFPHEDHPIDGIESDKPFCRFVEFRDSGDASVGEPGRIYWALDPDQSGTELADLIARAA